MANRVALRTNVHEDNSTTFDVLLSDNEDGDNVIEFNPESEQKARVLIAVLVQNGCQEQAGFTNRYDA